MLMSFGTPINRWLLWSSNGLVCTHAVGSRICPPASSICERCLCDHKKASSGVTGDEHAERSFGGVRRWLVNPLRIRRAATRRSSKRVQAFYDFLTAGLTRAPTVLDLPAKLAKVFSAGLTVALPVGLTDLAGVGLTTTFTFVGAGLAAVLPEPFCGLVR